MVRTLLTYLVDESDSFRMILVAIATASTKMTFGQILLFRKARNSPSTVGSFLCWASLAFLVVIDKMRANMHFCLHVSIPYPRRRYIIDIHSFIHELHAREIR